MKKYIIDGNNLIGKIQSLANLQKKDKQASRERLAHLVDRYFANKKVEVILNFDGFADQKIRVSKAKLVYSDKISADEKIKKQIEAEKNKRNVIVISSDNNVREFAKVCSCDIVSSEDFGKEITKSQNADDEESRIKAMDDIDTFKKLFEG
jgi:predicted RNA-binding protein with PIN domain